MTDTKQKTPDLKKVSNKPQAILANKPETVEVTKKKADIVELPKARKKPQPPQNKWVKLIRKHLLHKQAGRWFVGMVAAPWALSAIYYTGFASDRYVSEASFMIEKNNGSGSSIEGLSLFGVTPQASNDQRILETFIKSPDMLYYLDEKAGLRQHYETGDFLSRLAPEETHEGFP